MWCVTLKCRTEVPHGRTGGEFLSFGETLIPPVDGGTVSLPHETAPKLLPDVFQNAFLPIPRTFSSCHTAPVSVNQRCHPKVDLLLHVQVPVLIPRR
jgi:hypothetical protein